MNMEIDPIAEWDAMCRICLQEGQLHSLFDFDDEKSELNIAEKIMLCSPIVVWISTCFFDISYLTVLFIYSLCCYFFSFRFREMENYRNKYARSVYMTWMQLIDSVKIVNVLTGYCNDVCTQPKKQLMKNISMDLVIR